MSFSWKFISQRNLHQRQTWVARFSDFLFRSELDGFAQHQLMKTRLAVCRWATTLNLCAYPMAYVFQSWDRHKFNSCAACVSCLCSALYAGFRLLKALRSSLVHVRTRRSMLKCEEISLKQLLRTRDKRWVSSMLAVLQWSDSIKLMLHVFQMRLASYKWRLSST